jgi:hypothetical protein
MANLANNSSKDVGAIGMCNLGLFIPERNELIMFAIQEKNYAPRNDGEDYS